MGSIAKTGINWNVGVTRENFVQKTGSGKGKQREKMPLPYDIITRTEVSPPPLFCNFAGKYWKTGKIG
jgi:hypothetical protein